MLQKDGTAVLEAPTKSLVPKFGGPRRVPGAASLRRDLTEDFAGGRRVSAVADADDEIENYVRPRRLSGLRFRLKGGVPRSMVGRVMGAVVVLGGLVGFTAVLWEARTLLLHDERLVIPSSAAIEITGNNHLTRPQLLSVFGEDVDRNILTVSLADRKEQLESLPWVEHATVMRLLPNKVRVAISERTPVAFVRQGGQIGLVDANGVLLDLSPEVAADNHYSFPVVTGISAAEPASTREARMMLYEKFRSDLDAGSAPGEGISKNLSEVDLSSPEDVKALIPSTVNGSSDVLVHFGDDEFLKRYKSFEQNLPAWKTTYPKLASVDMRYEHNVVLEMAPGSAIPMTEAVAAPVTVAAVKAAPVVKVAGGRAARIAARISARREARAEKRAKKQAKVQVSRRAGGHLQTSFDVPAKGGGVMAKSQAEAGPQ